MGTGGCQCVPDSLAPLASLCLEGLALPVVGVLGLVGNTATVVVLRSLCVYETVHSMMYKVVPQR